jgi:hypothetical protein
MEIGEYAFENCDKLPKTVKPKVTAVRKKMIEEYYINIKGRPFEHNSRLAKGNQDVLTFERMDTQPGLINTWYDEVKNELYAKVIINGWPYLDIIKPYLQIQDAFLLVDALLGYFAKVEIYNDAVSVYKGLTERNKKGKIAAKLIDPIYPALDELLPEFVIVTETKNEVKWSVKNEAKNNHYDGELPVFRFEKKQYEEAMAQLKAIADEQNKLPSKESLGKGVYEGKYKNEKRSGYGTITWGDGSTLKGVWKKGKRDGLFIHTDANGEIRHEIWEDDILVVLPDNK